MKAIDEYNHIVVCGLPYSGKSTVAKTLAKFTDYKIVEIGQIVRDVVKNSKRTIDSSLVHQIEKNLYPIFLDSEKGFKSIIVGPRQKRLLESIRKWTPEGSVVFLWLDVSYDELSSRFEKKKHKNKEITGNYDDLLAKEEEEFATTSLMEYISDLKHSKIVEL